MWMWILLVNWLLKSIILWHCVEVQRSCNMTCVIARHCVVKINLGSLFGEQQHRRCTRYTFMQQCFVSPKTVGETVREVPNVQHGFLRQLNNSNGASSLAFGWHVIESTLVLRIFIILVRPSWHKTLQCKEIWGQIYIPLQRISC